MIYHFKSLVLVRKGREFYATLYQEVFFGNPGGGGSLKLSYCCAMKNHLTVCISEMALIVSVDGQIVPSLQTKRFIDLFILAIPCLKVVFRTFYKC